MKPARIEKTCTACGKAFSVPPCRDWREKQCSSECKAEARRRRVEELRLERTRNCVRCGSEFVVQRSQIVSGKGKHCSLSCSTKDFSETEAFKQARAAAGKTHREGVASGRIVRATGPDNPLWIRLPGRNPGDRIPKTPEQKLRTFHVQRIYRKRNPEKIREWSQKRSSAKTGKLPRGTVARIKGLQRSKCAMCGSCIKGGYHVDHIFPLAKGGKHEPHNIQLLCPTCNVRKSAKHPIVFAQQMGKLL